MSSDKILSMDKMTEVLDSSPMAIYVSAIDTWELLYMNDAAKKLMLVDCDHHELTCYEAAGHTQPCKFCHVNKMNKSELLNREFYFPKTGKFYHLSGKLIEWDGKLAHIEYIMDITQNKKENADIVILKEELQTTLSNIPCGLCVYRYDGTSISPIFHNPAFYEIMGYSKEHIDVVEKQTNFLGVHPDDLHDLKQVINKALKNNTGAQCCYRLWNDEKSEYRWISLDGSVKAQTDGTKLLYGVYNDVSEEIELKKELTESKEKIQDIVNAIPGGVAIYKVSDIYETVYFSDGVPGLSGYTVEEYKELIKRDAVELTYNEDTPMVIEKVNEAIANHSTVDFEFRKVHRDGHIVWVHVQLRQIGEEDGSPLIQCVFHDLSDLKETQLEMDHLINSIPGGIASYKVVGDKFVPTFYSEGVIKLSGHTREEFEELIRDDAINVIYGPDRPRVLEAAKKALISGEVLDISYRMRHKDDNLIWVHINGRRLGPLSDNTRFYVVFTGISAETRIFQSIANDTPDGIYVIDKSNFDLLYVNEAESVFFKKGDCLGKKCYSVLHGKNKPCEFCTLTTHEADGKEHEMAVDGTDRFYTTRFREMDWNGIPAYVKYIRDVTSEVLARREKERLQQYFQTVLENLPGGIAVVRYDKNVGMAPEYLSGGFAALTNMTIEQAWDLYREDAMAGVHPDDKEHVKIAMEEYIASGADHCDIVYRLRKGNSGYIWVKNTLSLLENEDGDNRVYAVYHDMTKELEEQEKLRRQYKDMIMQHYRTSDPNALVIGHDNVTTNMISEIIDHTGSKLLSAFGNRRDDFFRGIAGFIVDDEDRNKFFNIFLNSAVIKSYEKNETVRTFKCFVKFPNDEYGRYVEFNVNLVEEPDTGNITGILKITDVTERTISDRILHQLSVTSYDFVIDLDLFKDTFTIMECNIDATTIPPAFGTHSKWLKKMLDTVVVPRDKEQYISGLNADSMLARLQKEGSYTFSYSMTDDNGDIRTKNMTVSAIDLRLGRICLVRMDITDSIREQQGLLNMVAYTFELAGFIDVNSERFTLYTRDTILKKLSPYTIDHYDQAIERFASQYGGKENDNDMVAQFSLQTIMKRLAKKPNGYDFVFPYNAGEGLRYKQVNVLWGDDNHQTICLVRADVTDMLASERKTKEALEQALILAKDANQAKSDFLSAMSHDIRTPMNAIMGMTALATANLNNKEKVEDCLKKISISSKHLLSLVNDVLDMSKIERSKISLNHMKMSVHELVQQLSAIMLPQADEYELSLNIHTEDIEHEYFYGDSLRINQILINILSNALKFTPKGGSVDFLLQEIPSVKGGEYVRYRFVIRDTGIGMDKEFIEHIFDPFSRSDRAARIEGTGLGLSITKGLVDLMDGDISVVSQVNEGTAFTFELECKIAMEDSSSFKSDVKKKLSTPKQENMFLGCNFLIAEDNEINSEILCELLQMYGAETVVRTDGVQAVHEFENTQPTTYDAILMDIQMPEMNGYEATKAIRALNRPDAKEIPIIAMTANAFAEDIQSAMEAGMNAHVAKPIDIYILQNTLLEELSNKKR